jgi:Flp pilus assembly protein TadD
VEFHNALGLALRAAGRCAEAETSFRDALRLDPGFALCWNNLGLVLRDLGRIPEALDAFRQAVQHGPKLAAAPAVPPKAAACTPPAPAR